MGNFFEDLWDEVTRVADQVAEVVTPVLTVWNPALGPLVQGAVDLASGRSVRTDLQGFVKGLASAAGPLIGEFVPAEGMKTLNAAIPKNLPFVGNLVGSGTGYDYSSADPMDAALGAVKDVIGALPLPPAVAQGVGTAAKIATTTNLQENPMGWLDDPLQALTDLAGQASDIVGALENPLAVVEQVPGSGSIQNWLQAQGFAGPVEATAGAPGSVDEFTGPMLPATTGGGNMFDLAGAVALSGAGRLPRSIPLSALQGSNGQIMVPQGYHVKTLGGRRAMAARAPGAYAVRNRHINYLNLRALRRASSRLTGATRIVRHLFSLPKHTIHAKGRRRSGGRFAKAR